MSDPTDLDLDDVAPGAADLDDAPEEEIDELALEASLGERPPARHGAFSRLYHGETRIDFIGRWKAWFALSAVVIIIGAVALGTRGLNLGIDFTGGTVWKVPQGSATVAQVQRAMTKLGYSDVQVQQVTQSSGSGKGRFLSVEAEATAKPSAKTTAALLSTEKEVAALGKEVPKKAKAAVSNLHDQVVGVDGPFATDVPAPLTKLRAEIAAVPAAMAKVKGDTAKALAARQAVDKIQNRVDELSNLESAQVEKVGRNVSAELAKLTGSKVSQVTVDTVGPSWGKQISNKAVHALIVFLIAITLYITLRFEFRMAVATLAALVHDLVVVVGIYAVFGFPVTPATVIAILTILGFSIYDGIVVFDRVDENTRLLGKRSKITYSEMANTSLNQVLMRSLNTSITALLPITSVLLIGAVLLKATTLEEFGLALFLGLLSGAYSSIFIATPMLAMLKEREPRYRELREKVLGGRAAAAAGVGTAATGASGGGRPAATPAALGSVVDDKALAAPPGSEPRPRKQGKRR